MEKRGQTFLLATLIIIVTIIGLSVVYVSIKSSPDFKIGESLTKEFKYESTQVIDNAIFKNKNVNSALEAYIIDFEQHSIESGVDWDSVIVAYNDYRYPHEIALNGLDRNKIYFVFTKTIKNETFIFRGGFDEQ
jgi:hypothetical protein